MTFINKKTLGHLIFAGALVLAPLTAKAESLTDALIAAYNHSGLLDQNRALLRAADEGVAQAVALVRPIITYSAGATHVDTVTPGQSGLSSTAALNAQLTLLDWGRSDIQFHLARSTVLATRSALASLEQQVLLRAAVAFLNVRRTQDVVGLRENNLSLLREELRAAQDRFELGEVTRTDVALTESRLAAARSSLAAAKGDLAGAREEYRAATGRYPGHLSAPPRLPNVPESRARAEAIAVQSHPNARQAQREVEAADFSILAAEAAMKPTLTGNAALRATQDGYASSSVGVNLSGTIYQGGQLTSLYRQAVARRDAARANLHVVSHNLRQNVGNAWSSLQVANATVAATNEQVRAAEIAFRGTREEARLGSRTTLDVLNAEQELLTARANRVSASIQRHIAVYNVLQSAGLMSAKHLNLGIVTYDPEAYYNTVRTAPTRKVSPQGEQLDRVLRSLGKF